jgi:hypothetical protein
MGDIDMEDQQGTSDDPATTLSSLRRLRTTPMRDLVRGRVTGRLDLRHLLESSTLSDRLGEFVIDVVRRTRLRRLERIDVARELIEHFEDGISAGVSEEALVAGFGERRIAATLIRRGMTRKRTWFDWAVRRTALVASLFVAGFVAIYLVLAIRHWNEVVRIDVDYVARIREASAGASPAERGWPDLREAMVELRELAGPTEGHRDHAVSSLVNVAMTETVPPWNDVVMEPAPVIPEDDAPSPEACAEFFDRATPAITALRLAASKPILGFPMGADGTGSEIDRDFLGLTAPASIPPADRTVLDGAVIGLQFPYFGTVRLASRILSADARRAAERGDGPRFVSDVEAMFGFGRQVRTPTILIGQLVGLSIERLAFMTILDVLAANPEAIDDESLVRLRSIVSGLDEDRLRIRVDHERYFFLDLAQRFYTDDGDGNGRLKFTSNGAAAAGLALAPGDPGRVGGGGTFDFLLGPLVANAVIDRREATEIWNRNMDRIEAGNRSDPWDFDASDSGAVYGSSVDVDEDSWLSRLRLFPISMLLPATENLTNLAAGVRLERDLVRTVIELEFFRRAQGVWPESIDELEFAGLDPFDGQPLRYRVRDDAPVLYILGPDRIDDGGRWIEGPNGIARTARDGMSGTTRYWGRVPIDPGEGLVGDVPVWIGGAATAATGGES